jgi:hypothetical protein
VAPPTDTTDQVRLLLGGPATTLVSDDQLDFFLAEADNGIYLAAASGAEFLAAYYASAYDFSTDQQSFKRSSLFDHYMALAASFRARAAGLVVGPGGALIGTVSTIDSTRIDGFSSDIPNQDVGVTATNPRRRFSGPLDEPPF